MCLKNQPEKTPCPGNPSASKFFWGITEEKIWEELCEWRIDGQVVVFFGKLGRTPLPPTANNFSWRSRLSSQKVTGVRLVPLATYWELTPSPSNKSLEVQPPFFISCFVNHRSFLVRFIFIQKEPPFLKRWLTSREMLYYSNLLNLILIAPDKMKASPCCHEKRFTGTLNNHDLHKSGENELQKNHPLQ